MIAASLLVVLLGLPQAPAASRPAGPAVPPAEALERLLRHLSTDGQFPPAVRRFVEEARRQTAGGDPRDVMRLCLGAAFAGFKRGLDALEADQPAAAADAFEGLCSSDDPFLAVGAAVLAAGPLLELDQVDRCHRLLRAVQEAHHPIDRFTAEAEQFHFALGYCQLHMLDYDAAYQTLTGFLQRFPEAPERLRLTATQIVTELTRRVPRGLGDVRDLLSYARRHLHQGDTGQAVTRRQEEAVALIDELIREAEEKEKSQAGRGGQGQSGKGGGSPTPGAGARQSRLPEGGAGETILGRRRRVQPGETWGRMPPREREEILQNIQRQFPGRYRELLEQYYQQLAKDAPAP